MLDALDVQLIGKRPSRLSPANYSDIKSYRQDLATRNGDYASAKDALARAYRAVSIDILTVDDLLDASKYAWRGRLSCEPRSESPNVVCHWYYTAGQYYPLEVYAAIAAVLDRAILNGSQRVA